MLVSRKLVLGTSSQSFSVNRSIFARRAITAAAVLVSIGTSVQAAQFTVVSGQTDLNAGATFGQPNPPTSTDDLVFAAATYSPTAFTAGSALGIATLNDLDATQALGISGAGTITLNGGTNAVAPAMSDLLYVANGGTLNVSNNVAVAATGNFDSVGNSTLSGTVSGGAGAIVTKSGGGTLVMSGNNTYAGGTRLTAGTLTLGSSSVGTAGTVGSDGALTSGALGTGNLQITGTYLNFELNGQTFGNRFVVAANNDTIKNSSAATAYVTGANDGSLNGNVISDFTVNTGAGNIDWSGAISRTNGTGTITKNGAYTLILSGSGAGYKGMNYTVNDGTLAFNLANGTTFNSGNISVSSGKAVTATVGSGVTQTIQNGISGAGTFTQSGQGTTILTGGSNLTGGTTVNAGTLKLTVGGGDGTLGGVITINSGGLVQTTAGDALGYNNTSGAPNGRTTSAINVNGGTFDNAAAGNNGYVTTFNLTGGSVTSTGGGAINFAANATYTTLNSLASATTSVFSAPIVLRNSTSLPITTAAGTTASGIDLNITGAIGQNGGSYGITKAGAGVLNFGGANTYNGATLVNAGTLQAGVASVAGVSGAFGNGTAVTLSNTAGATLALNGFSNQIASLAGGGTTGGNVSLGSATLTLGQNNASGVFAGAISGGGSISKIGTGTAELDGSSNFAGGVSVTAGFLTTNDSTDTAFGTGTIAMGSGTTLNFNGNGNRTFANSFTFAGGTLNSYDGDIHVGNSTSTIAINGATSINRQYGHGDTRKKLNFDGIVSGSAALTLNGINNGFSEGGGLAVTNNANTYSGTITVNSTTGQGMTLIDGGATALQFATVDVEGNGTNDTPYGLRFNPGVTTPTVGALTGTGRIALQDLAGTPAAVTLNVGSNGSSTSYSGALSGAGGLTKSGGGTMAITGVSTYTGATSVTNGALSIGSATALTGASGTGGVSVAGGSLASTVTSAGLGGNLSLSTGSLDANGASVGAFALAAGKTFAMSGGVFNETLASTASYDQIALASGASTFAITGGTLALSGPIDYSNVYDILNNFTGTVSGLTITGYDSANYTASLNTSGDLSFTAVPEPVGLSALGVLSLLGIRRRRAN